MKSLILALALIGAGAVQASQADEIRVAKSAGDVAACQVVGQVQSMPPYWTLHAALNQVKAQAASLHADTILLTSSKLNGWFTTATAYRCAK
jgi:hypothetical protein